MIREFFAALGMAVVCMAAALIVGIPLTLGMLLALHWLGAW